MTNRREFIAALGGAAAWPLAAHGQRRQMPVIGYLNGRSREGDAPFTAAFRQGLSEASFVEQQNVAIEYRFADGQSDRLPGLAADLVRRRVIVIAAIGGSALAAKEATDTIPIVFSVGRDPVATGLVASLARPGGNLTGVTNLGVEVAPKQLELLHELVPAATAIAFLINPIGPNAETLSRAVHVAARALGLELHVLHASAERDLNAVFATLAQLRAGGLVIGADPLFNAQVEQLAALALRHGIPAIYPFREFAAAGGLMSYGGSVRETIRLAGIYTGRILKGEKPSELPVQQVTKVELRINLKTAEVLGLTLPLTLRARADEVIE
jgi:ABC-type uncharacterized transport system substrate-binding protein